MRIEYKKGDLFGSPRNAILHGCNAKGVMGSGVAKLIKNKYPGAYKAYRSKWEEDQTLEVGSLINYKAPNGTLIINAITQESYGYDPSERYVSYSGIEKAMISVNLIDELYGEEVHMPMIGAGLGGGDWTIISDIIQSNLVSVQPVVWLY